MSKIQGAIPDIFNQQVCHTSPSKFEYYEAIYFNEYAIALELQKYDWFDLHEYPYITMRKVKGGLYQTVVQMFRIKEDREEYDKYRHTVHPEEVYYHELQSQVHLKD